MGIYDDVFDLNGDGELDLAEELIAADAMGLFDEVDGVGIYYEEKTHTPADDEDDEEDDFFDPDDEDDEFSDPDDEDDDFFDSDDEY